MHHHDNLTSPYNYIPTRSIAIIFLSLYGVSTLLHAAQAVRHRMWWLFVTACFCGFIEILGWSGRLWSSFSPLLSTPFQIEITCTIVAPTPLLAANFVILGEIMRRLGTHYSRLRPKIYTIVFVSCDIISLVVQGVGGGIAATADDLAGSNRGAKIMLGGIVFQVIVIVMYSILAIDFFWKYHLNQYKETASSEELNDPSETPRGRLTGKLLLMSVALAFSTTVLFTRAIYRTAELADGWKGKIISNQLLFNVLDGAMVVLAMYTINIAHPGVLLARPSEEEKETTEIKA